MNTIAETQVRLLASPKNWIEAEAVRQLYACASLDGVRSVIGFPDLHPGEVSPVGTALIAEGRLYPHLIGGDIGCGMALFRTNLVRSEAKVDRWASLSIDLEQPCDRATSTVMEESNAARPELASSLGTLGGGNHFAEVQAVENVLNATQFKKLGIGKQQLVILVHSGSRGLGDSILQAHLQEHGVHGISPDSAAARDYLRGHDRALRWAKSNRELIAQRFAAAIGAEAEGLWDGCHNQIQPYVRHGETLWVHRKGAVQADVPWVVIPGSRGTLSYLIKPTQEVEQCGWSLAHGAGRKWSRSDARQRMRERFGMEPLMQTPLGNRVICEDRNVLYEEAPAAYKTIEDVIEDLVDAGVASVIATLRPLLTYKMRKPRR